MKPFSTARLLPVLLLLFGTGSAFAQDDPGPELGDDFIFFRNSTNTMVPEFDGTIMQDSRDSDESQKVMEYIYGERSYQAFRFPRDVGVDLSQNRDDGDVLHVVLRLDPANQGKDKLGLLFEDKTDDSGANDGSADLPFRLVWRVPQDLRDGEWHELDIPLPPATWQELEDAKDAGTLDDLAEHWVYAGAWSSGSFGVGVADEAGPNTTDNPDLWEEFEWTNVGSLGFIYDNNQGGGNVWVDDLYIGAEDLDLGVADDPPDQMTGVTFTPKPYGTEISWTHDDKWGGYYVFASDDLESGIIPLAYVPFTASEFKVEHRFELPHWDFQGTEVWYFVTSLSYFGVENGELTLGQNAGLIANPGIRVQPFIVELTQAEADALSDDLAAGNVRMDGFPDNLNPFRLNQSHFTQGDSGVPDDDTDNSGEFYAAYDPGENELWIYSEVTDNTMEFATAPTGDAWQFDSVEFGWGNYDVRDQNSPEGRTNSFLLDVLHYRMERGDFADYVFRFNPTAPALGEEITGTSTFIGDGIDDQRGTTIAEYMTDGGGTPVGYKMLTTIPLDEIQAAGDAVLTPPASDEMRLIPMNIALNDADGSGRESQIIWSTKYNADNFWWRTPAQWPAVGMVGNEIRTAVATDPEVPASYVLEQNYPNPFNPATSFRFALPTAETVTLAVYDVMGRQVALLADGKAFRAGTHTMRFDASHLASGLYVYRLQAGDSFVQTRRMLLVK